MNGAKIIIGKELTRVFKDKRLVFSMFILPGVLIIVIYSLMGKMISSVNADVEEHVSRVYIQSAPEGLEAVLGSTGFSAGAEVSFLSSAEDTEAIKKDILDGNIDLLAVFDSDFVQKTEAYANPGDAIPSVTVYYNTTENYSSAAENKFSSMVLEAVREQQLEKRLGNMEMLEVFEAKTEVIADEDKENGQFLSMMLPYLITFMLFVGAMSLGVDSITGEKERGTMASMLLSPIKRSQIVFGKLISLAIMSSLSAVIYSVAMIVSLPMMEGGITGVAGSISFSALQVVQLLAIMLVMVFLYVSLVSLAAVAAKTAKEANTYVSPIYIIVVLAGLLTMYQGGMDKELFQYAIPVYGNALAIQNLLLNELTMAQFGVTLLGTGAVAIILTVLITKAFNSEKLMFNA